MKISIIIPIYNVSKYIERCLNSVLAQSYIGELECILVNDCTPDNSMKIAYKVISQYCGSIDIKTICHYENKGLSAARNSGIEASTGEYLFFLDSDDEITPTCIETLANLVYKYKDVDIAQGNIVVTSEQVKWLENSQYNFPDYTNDTLWIRSNMLHNIPVTSWNKLIRKELIIKHHLFFKEGIIHEDEHWRYFAHKHIKSIAFTNIPTYYYYINENSIMTSRFKDKSVHSWLCIFREYIPTITDKHEYSRIILYIATFPKKTNLLKEPAKFRKEYNNLMKEQIFSRSVPLSIKFSFIYLLHPSHIIVTLCRLFFKRSYKIICQINKL